LAKKQIQDINISLPRWIVAKLDKQAKTLGVNRKALINFIIAGAVSKTGKAKVNGDSWYLAAIQESFAEEWLSKQDEEAFSEL